MVNMCHMKKGIQGISKNINKRDKFFIILFYSYLRLTPDDVNYVFVFIF